MTWVSTMLKATENHYQNYDNKCQDVDKPKKNTTITEEKPQCGAHDEQIHILKNYAIVMNSMPLHLTI